MDSYLYSPVAKKAFSCSRSINVENSNALDDSSFLDVTTSPIRLIEGYEKPQKISEISLDTTIEQENSLPPLEIGLNINENSYDIFDTIDDIPETPKPVEIIDLTTPKKALQNRSPLLPTQPLPTMCSTPIQRRSRVRCNGTLDSWINREPPPKLKSVNADECALWLNISPDISSKKLTPVTTANKKCNENADITTNDLCSSQISSKSVSDSAGIRPTFPSSSLKEFRKLKPSSRVYTDENLSKFLHISPWISSRFNTNQISEKITEVQNSPLRSTLPVTSPSQKRRNENDQDIISSLSDGSFFPLTPPPDSLRKSETLRQMSLATMLNRSNVAECCAVMETQHTRSLMNAISSPTFCRNDLKYVDNELSSRFNDDGKVRRKKAERRLLHGFDCRCCADYYEALGLNHDQRNERIDQVSKHRDIEKKPSTPEYYWEIGMPNREEQRRRGQIIESNSPIALKTRCSEYKSKRRARRRLFN
uniref:SAE2 domain-containing protein n=1 Tax=Elaeophora elaphi TaxID=1147741 RepID=A0A0R3RPM9_9BILA